jgi:hypothetical protein
METVENCIKILNKVVYYKNDLNVYALDQKVVDII